MPLEDEEEEEDYEGSQEELASSGGEEYDCSDSDGGEEGSGMEEDATFLTPSGVGHSGGLKSHLQDAAFRSDPSFNR